MFKRVEQLARFIDGRRLIHVGQQDQFSCGCADTRDQRPPLAGMLDAHDTIRVRRRGLRRVVVTSVVNDDDFDSNLCALFQEAISFNEPLRIASSSLYAGTTTDNRIGQWSSDTLPPGRAAADVS